MATKLQFRRDTVENWETKNPVLSEGELGLDLTNGIFKIGDGFTAWNDIQSARYGNGMASDNLDMGGYEVQNASNLYTKEQTDKLANSNAFAMSIIFGG